MPREFFNINTRIQFYMNKEPDNWTNLFCECSPHCCLGSRSWWRTWRRPRPVLGPQRLWRQGWSSGQSWKSIITKRIWQLKSMIKKYKLIRSIQFSCMVLTSLLWNLNISSDSYHRLRRNIWFIIEMMKVKTYLNSERTQSRSFCCLSPWMHMAGQPSLLINRVSSSHLRFVSTKMRILAVVSEPISSSRRASLASFWYSSHTSTI